MELFITIILYLGFIPLIILLFKKKAFDFSEPILPFIWITAIASIYEIFIPNLFRLNASYWFQIYPFLEITGLYFYFFKLFSGRYRLIVNLILVALLLVYSFSFFLWDSETNLKSHSINKSALTICILIGCFNWFKNLFKDMEEESLWKLPDFYFISAVLI